MPPKPEQLRSEGLRARDQVVGGTGLAVTVREGSEAEAEGDFCSLINRAVCISFMQFAVR